MVSLKDLPAPSTIYSAYASISASIMLFRTTFHQVVPRPVQDYLVSAARSLFFKHRKTSKLSLVVDQFDGMAHNDIFESFEIYMSTKSNPTTNRLRLTKNSKDKHISVKLAQSEIVTDIFQDVEITWMFQCQQQQPSQSQKNSNANNVDNTRPWPLRPEKSFHLIFEKIHRETVLDSYVPFVLEKAKAIRDEKKAVRLHTLGNGGYSDVPIWSSIILEHPSTFDKLAMEPDDKKALMDDLDLFLQRKEFYKRVGRAWKRGYLLYGPPGTGKSSLIAAIANYLKFDIYDLQLTNVRHDSGLRKLLTGTTNRSILVIEDIDCTGGLPDRNARTTMPSDHQPPRPSSYLQFTLSGLLNFIDGLWSSCGDERIIIFTTNNKDALDPALLRPGRMDMHVHMSYLKMKGFKLLAASYLGIKDEQHSRYGEIEELLGDMQVTPAEVAEELMKTSDVDVCLGGVVNFLKRKKMESHAHDDDHDNTTTNGIESDEDNSANGIELPDAKRLKTNGY